jgi:endonuclease/exonuclease/phosphatase family metal-dependent hydrolase
LPSTFVRVLGAGAQRAASSAVSIEVIGGPIWEGQPLRVLVTHFGLTAAERRVQVMLVLGELHLEHERLTILLGDFNEWLPGGRPLRALRTRFGRDRTPRTFPSWRPLLALDRMWGQPRRALGPLRAHGTRLARLASDHLPIVATVTREG